jgi:uncharacterized membrane protein HdeD (DUF308 family)
MLDHHPVLAWVLLIYCLWLLAGIMAMTSPDPFKRPCRAAEFAILSFIPIYFACRGIAIAWKWLFGERS